MRPISKFARSLAECVVLLCLAAASGQASATDSLDLSAYRGKVVLMDFWASWCEPCRRSFPWLNEMSAKYAAQGLVVIGINVDRSEAVYQQFIQRSGITFANAFDPSADISASFGTYKYPETYLINRDGKVLEKFVGAELWTSDQTMQRIQRHLPNS